eukprot:g10263.t1
MVDLKEEGMQKVKEEPGITKGQAMTTTAEKHDAVPDSRLKTATTTMLPKPAPIAALPQPTAAAATAMASMFAGFPGGFNAAAFAKAAAAAFPVGLPNLAAAPPASAMSSPAFGVATNAAGTSKPATKRRKRGRAAEEHDAETPPPAGASSVKPEGRAGGAAMGATAGGNAKVSPAPPGGPLAAKLAENPAPGVAISPQPGAAAGGGGVTAGASAKGAWAAPAAAEGTGGTTINVLTPNLFNGDMSHQERKERRKIRNRMSAQQHRERQRQRVDALEGCLRERDEEIAKLREQVAFLTSRNQRLADRVQELEQAAGETEEPQKQGQQQQRGVSSTQPFLGATITQAASGSFCCGHAAAAAAAAAARDGKGSGGETSDGGGITTEDQAHSSSSESDSDDLSPMSSLDNRSGGPGTPPLSPIAAGAVDPSTTITTTGGAAAAAAAVLSAGSSLEGMVEFSLSATALDMDEAMVDAASSLSPPAGTLSRSFSRVAAAVASSDIGGYGGIASGGGGGGGDRGGGGPLPPVAPLAAMEFSAPDGVAAAAAPARAPEAASPREGACTSGLLAFDSGAGGENDLASCEDQLTMEALDPMEIDALLACAGDGGDIAANDPFATSGGGSQDPSQLEAGNNIIINNNNDNNNNDHNNNLFGDNDNEAPQAFASSSSPPATRDGDRVGDGAARPQRVCSRSRHSASGAGAAGSSASAGGGARVLGGVCGGGGSGLPSGDGGRRQAGGGGVASTVAAGVMGALCLAGVVINSGAPGSGKSSSLGTALVAKSSSQASALVTSRGGGGGRVLSADRGDDDAEDAEYANTTHAEPWLFHPVEAEPWRWRATAARERRGPWVWERALNLFGNAGIVSDHPVGGHDTPCNDDVVGVYSKEEGGEDEDEEGRGDGYQETYGKELDLFYRGVDHDDGLGRRIPGDGGGGGGGGSVGGGGARGGRRGGQEIVAGAGTTPGGLPPERTSYMFCPEAHGMMSGGMIERASKATYDYHHPGARPCPAAAAGASTVGDDGALHGSGQVKVNVIDPRHHHHQQKERLRLLAAAGDTSADLSGPGADAAAAAAEAHALVPSHANVNVELDRLGMGLNDGVFFSSDRDGREALGEGRDASSRPPQRRGPTPIHGAVNAGPQGNFHEGLRHSPSADAEFLTMLVPSNALDWGPSTLAVRAALNGTATDDASATAGGGGGGGEAMSWVEIDCQILNARLVQDVSFKG